MNTKPECFVTLDRYKEDLSKYATLLTYLREHFDTIMTKFSHFSSSNVGEFVDFIDLLKKHREMLTMPVDMVISDFEFKKAGC